MHQLNKKEAGPESDFTEHALRAMVSQNLIQPVMAGSKSLINYDQVLVHLALGGETTGSDSVTSSEQQTQEMNLDMQK